MQINRKRVAPADQLDTVYPSDGIDTDLRELCSRLGTEGYLFFTNRDPNTLDRVVWTGYDLIYLGSRRRLRLYALKPPPTPLLPVGGVLAHLGNKTPLRELCTRLAHDGSLFAIVTAGESLRLPEGYTARIAYKKGDIELFACKKD